MDDVAQALSNYTRPGLATEVITRARAAAGDSVVTTEHLSLFDEFHMGGRFATARVAAALGAGQGDRVVDVGSGLGGPARLVAETTGAQVCGVDLSPDFVGAADELTALVGLGHAVSFGLGDAARLPFDDAAFSHAMMLHVGMNVADKTALFVEVSRVLAPGGVFVVFDLCLTGEGVPDYPVPWAADAESSYLAPFAAYQAAFAEAGLVVDRTEDLSGDLLELAARQRAGEVPGQQQMVSALFGEGGPTRFANLGAALGSGVVAPMLMVARRA